MSKITRRQYIISHLITPGLSIATRKEFHATALLITVFVLLFILGLPRPALCSTELLKETFNKGVVSFYMNKYKEAIGYFEKTLEYYPDLAQSFYYLGLCYRTMSGKQDKAVEMFNKAIEKDPAFADAYEALGKMYYGLGDVDNAEKTLIKAVELDPDNVSSNLSLGWIYLLGKSDPSEAIYYFEKAIDKTDLSYAYVGLGMAYILDGQKFKALGMITSLRQMGKEEMALELERLTRKGHFALPNLEQARSMQQKDEEKSALSKYDKAGNMDVNINLGPPSKPASIYKKNRYDTHDESSSVPISPYSSSDERITGEDRIRQLKQRGQSIFQ